MSQSQLKIAIVVGEDSGDLLGADLIEAFLKKYPQCEFKGIAGPKMQQLGCESLYSVERLSVIGIGAILKRLPSLLKMRRDLASQIIDWKPDLFIGIDAPEFNLGLELKLKKAGIKTVHYVSPSVWAWRKKRIFKIKKAVDYMLTLFPFETDIYHQHHIPVACVGHPLALMLPMEPEVEQARSELSIDADAKVLAVLPGSRGSELKFLGELFLEVVARLLKNNSKLVILVPMINEKRYQQFTEQLKVFQKLHQRELNIRLINGQSRTVMCAADVVLLASGTATLEAALLKKPMIVAYKVSKFSMMIYRRLISIELYSLPNLLMSKPLVKEFIQEQATSEKITPEVEHLLQNGLSAELKTEYEKLHRSLSLGGGKEAVKQLMQHFQF